MGCPYAYGTQYCPIRVRDIPYAYGPIYAYRAEQNYAIPDELWLDDPSKWPEIQFGDIYTYLIDTPGIFTKENLRAYKSLEAYNYFWTTKV